MNNYEYISQFVLKLRDSKDFRILDYGCGAGETVMLLRAKGVDAFGCDLFYAGGDYSGLIPHEEWEKSIFRMNGETIPFPDESFNFVTSNQVLEHVKDLDSVLKEINRVLKPGGQVLSLFPSAESWRESHCGIPFLHWFKKGSKLRLYYAFLLRTAGLGHYKLEKGRLEWAMGFCDYIDNWTFYRNYAQIKTSFSRYFSDIEHFEADWLAVRWPKFKFLPKWVRREIALKWGTNVFICRKC